MHIINRRPCDVRRKKIGRELNPLKVGFKGPGQRLHGEGFGEAGNPLDEAVSPAEKPDEHPLDHVALPDDDLRQLRLDVVDKATLGFDESVNGFDVLRRFQ